MSPDGAHLGEDEELPSAAKKPCSVIEPSLPTWRNRTPSSYSDSATRPPFLNVGCSWNQCTEQPRWLAIGLPSVYVPLPAASICDLRSKSYAVSDLSSLRLD